MLRTFVGYLHPPILQPKVKKTKGTFSIETVWNRLNAIGHKPYPITLDGSIAGVTVTREFMTEVYGGNTQETFPSIRIEKLRIHGLDDFMYPNLAFNPCAPQTPGAPGLFFKACGRPADDWPMVQRVITRIERNVWHYVGQYKLAPAPSLTKEEWAFEDPQVFLPSSPVVSMHSIFLPRFATHGLLRYVKEDGA